MRKASVAALAILIAACGPDRPVSISYEIESVADDGSAEPNLSVSADGTTILSWLEPYDDGVALRYSTLREMRWSDPVTVATGNDWFVNWADFPSVVKIDEFLWASHWLAKRPGGTYAYDVAISLSRDNGQTWKAAVTPHTDETATEHGFVSLFPWQGGVGVVWLDGREGDHMTLRAAVIGRDGRLLDEQVIDDLVCDCCQTDATVGPDGPLVVYRDRTPEEIRDIHIARSRDDSWVDRRPIADDGWRIAGCPVNGPAIAGADRRVAVAWFTAAEERPRVRFTLSTDGGASFGEPVEVASVRAAGRVAVVLLENGDALVSWLRTTKRGTAEIVVRRIVDGRHTGPEYIVAETTAGRMSGFPQMVQHRQGALLAWTDAAGEQTIIRSAYIESSKSGEIF